MTSNPFEPLLTTTDWNAEWARLQDARQKADDPSVWDERAKTYPVKHGSQQGYVQRFLELADVLPSETVLDMGCGTGALATPLAQAGHRVIACDFSAGMLDAMRADQEQLDVQGVEIHQMSWEDDWTAHGIEENCADVALASRSIATHDLKASLLKLDAAARRRACITLPASLSSRSDDALLAAAGFQDRIGLDFLYAFNILAQLGKKPEVAYIPNTRLEVFETFEDALAGFTKIAAEALTGMATDDEVEAIPANLRPWLEENLVQDDQGFHLAQPRKVTWAFIAWETGTDTRY